MLRCAVLMHLRGESYRGLAFALVDSLSAQRFARLDPARRPPGKSVLQAAVGAVGAASWEAINRTLLEMARASGVETGDRVRIDSTVTETHILEPSDSRLLFDGVRVLTRQLGQARDELGAAAVDFHDHCRAAKRRALEAGSQRGAERRAKIYIGVPIFTAYFKNFLVPQLDNFAPNFNKNKPIRSPNRENGILAFGIEN